MAAANMAEGPAIGIDLGTTFSCVAVVRNGKVEVLANELGNLTTPSFVAFNEVERLIGDPAQDEISSNAANTVFGVKRLIGRKFNDPVVQKDMQQWPFNVVDVDGMPKVQVTYKNEVKLFTAEEISGMVLTKMKEIAESYLNATVKDAVVTVPAYFNDMQRKATRDAGTIAGLNILSIISEPTAAALAYGLKEDTKIAKNVLVYDLGGGTFDVSILNICGNEFVVKATAGDSHLGGEDFDEILMNTFAAEFKHKTNMDIAGNKGALRRLRTACERAKRQLSSATQAYIKIESLCGGIDFVTTLTRARFDKLCEDLFKLTIKVVSAALKDAGLESSDIETVLLVGGSTRILKIQQLLRELFEGKEISKAINPDEAVAYGAAVQAAKFHGSATNEMQNMKLIDVTPLTLGISVEEASARFMSPIIERNTPIPVSKTKIFDLHKNQTLVGICVLQGEHTFTEDNFEIGYFNFGGLPVKSGRPEQITVTFTIDANGILSVSAVCNSNERLKGELKITNVSGSLTKEEIDRMVTEAENCLEQEKEQYHTARWELQQYCDQVKDENAGIRNFISEKCDEVLSWLDTCVRPSINQFHQMKNELKTLISIKKGKKPKMENDDSGVEFIPVNDMIYEIDD